MGRYGNVLLVGGETDPAFTARTGEVLRLWLTNTANSRVFRVALPGARMKLVGGDNGRMEREEFVDDGVLAPSERAVVDVLFDRPGEFALEHRTPERTYRLAAITVTGEAAEPPLREEFDHLRSAPELATERQQLNRWPAAPPDKVSRSSPRWTTCRTCPRCRTWSTKPPITTVPPPRTGSSGRTGWSR